jgi:hypothetical protein
LSTATITLEFIFVNAAEIIEEIKQLSPGEQAQVCSFVRSLPPLGTWTPDELSRAAALLAAESDPGRVRDLRERIAAGFYGDANA